MIESIDGFWWLVLILFGLALLVTSCGFKKFVYFMSVGYGLAVFAIGTCLLVMALGQFDFVGLSSLLKENPMVYVLSIILMLYGLRLAGYLLYREIKSASYRKTLEKVAGKEEKKMPFFVKFTIWIMVAVMYLMQTYPVLTRLYRPYDGEATSLILPIIGAVIALLGLVIETSADLEKNAAKKKNPHEFVSSGLYRFVRCPNYLGEILFWTGIFVSGCDVFKKDWAAWLISILGYLLIIYVMLSGAKRLEKRQNKNYGKEEAYQAYIKKTPILMHLIPVKSLLNWKWVV